MISSDTKRVLAATLPAVEGALDDITPNFYNRLFTAHPALLDDLFNRTNQQIGKHEQLSALTIREELPKTMIGKLDCKALIAEVLAQNEKGG
mgnify:CR=1 FL=1